MIKIITCIPAGRKRYLEILARHLLQEDIVDEHHLWLNTSVPSDIEYIHSLAATNPKFKVINHPKGGLGIADFYHYCTDKDTIYVRIDDDIVYIEPGAIKKLVDFRIGYPEFFVIYGNCINNAICTFLHQQMGLYLFGINKICTCNALCPVGWRDGEFAETVHRYFLGRVSQTEIYKFSKWIFSEPRRMSVNVTCWFGKDFAPFNGLINEHEEVDISIKLPMAYNKQTVICGQALFVHFAFFPQRPHLESTSLLEEYLKLRS